jgi:hypothetical protein
MLPDVADVSRVKAMAVVERDLRLVTRGLQKRSAVVVAASSSKPGGY